MSNAAVFLDRDGTINEANEFIKKPEDAVIIRKAARGIKLLNSLGLKVIVVTNQPQVARGMCTEDDVKRINEKIAEELKKEGARIDAFYYCPHHPETHHKDIPQQAMKYRIQCACRKPKAGMLEQAAKDFGIDLKSSFMVGDKTVDIKCGENAGSRTILVKTGMGGADGECKTKPDFVADDLCEAAELIKNTVTMKTLILAGGRGERLGPLTDAAPKPMLPIGGKPLLQHLIELSKKHGIKNIVLSGHYLFGRIKGYFGDGKRFGVNIEYVDDGQEPLGSGGAVKNCEKLLPANFVVMSGDVFTNIDLWELVKFHFSKGGIATLVVRETDHPQDTDIIQMDGDRAVNFFGKSSGHKVGNIGNTGLFVLRKDIIGFISGRSNLENDVIANAVKAGKVYCYLNTKYYIKDMGTHERYKKVEEDVKRLGL